MPAAGGGCSCLTRACSCVVMQVMSTAASSVALCPTILIDQLPSPTEGEVVSAAFVGCPYAKTNNVCGQGAGSDKKQRTSKSKFLSAPELNFHSRRRRHSSSEKALSTHSNASSSTLSTSSTAAAAKPSSLLTMFPTRRLSSTEAFTLSYLQHNHRPKSATTTLSVSNVFKNSKSNTVLDERDYAVESPVGSLSHSTSMYHSAQRDTNITKPTVAERKNSYIQEGPPSTNTSSAGENSTECAEDLSIDFNDCSIMEPAIDFTDGCNTNRELCPKMPTKSEFSVLPTLHQRFLYSDSNCDINDQQCSTTANNDELERTMVEAFVDDENSSECGSQLNKKRTLSLSVPSTIELLKNPTRSLTENFATLRNRLQNFSDSSTPSNTSRHVSQLNVSNERKTRHIKQSHTSFSFISLKQDSNFLSSNGHYVIQSSKRSFLFSSPAAKYSSVPMVTCKCIIASDVEKHGKALFEKLKNIKCGRDQDNSSSSRESSMGDVIDRVVYNATTLTFMRAVTTRVLKLSDAVGLLETLEPSVNNVLLFSLLGCYGHSVSFVPNKSSLEKLLLQMEVPYDDDELDSKESRRVLHNFVLLRLVFSIAKLA